MRLDLNDFTKTINDDAILLVGRRELETRGKEILI